MIPSDFAFNAPGAGYLFLGLIPLTLFFIALFRYRKKMLGLFSEPSLLADTLIPRSPFIYWSKCAALSLAWVFLTLALMQPQGNAHYPHEQSGREEKAEQRRKTQELILLIDASASMAVKDSRNGMARLDYARDIADQVVRGLTGESVSLYAFTSEVTPLSPATMDYLFVRLMLRQLHINEGDVAGTDIVKALTVLHGELIKIPTNVPKRLILMSDGGDTALEAMSDSKREGAIDALLNLYDDASSIHLSIDTVGLGVKTGGIVPDVTYEGKGVSSALEDELLRRLALRGNGHYYEANLMTTPDIAESIHEELREDAAHAPSQNFNAGAGGQAVIHDLYFQFPLGCALLLLLFVAGWPNARKEAV